MKTRNPMERMGIGGGHQIEVDLVRGANVAGQDTEEAAVVIDIGIGIISHQGLGESQENEGDLGLDQEVQNVEE